MDIRRLAFAAILPPLAAACTSPQPASPVRIAQASEVAQCAYVVNLSNKPGLYGQLATQGEAYARKAILDDAARAGANTVVFDKVEPGAMVTEITATAYHC